MPGAVRGAEIPAWCTEKWPLKLCFQTQTLVGIIALRVFFFPLRLVYSGLCDAQANGRRLCNFVVYVF